MSGIILCILSAIICMRKRVSLEPSQGYAFPVLIQAAIHIDTISYGETPIPRADRGQGNALLVLIQLALFCMKKRISLEPTEVRDMRSQY
jgi:hypothetical protein